MDQIVSKGGSVAKHKEAKKRNLTFSFLKWFIVTVLRGSLWPSLDTLDRKLTLFKNWKKVSQKGGPFSQKKI